MKFIFSIFIVLVSFQLFAQPTPPSNVTVRLEEASGTGCAGTTDCTAGTICYDVIFSIDEDGWNLQSYNIWMDYGADNSVMSYLNDASCFHTDGGFLDIDAMGKYRFSAASFPLNLTAGTEVIIHNFCVSIEDFSALNGMDVASGGTHFDFVTSVNLIEQGNSVNSINPLAPASPLTVSPINLTCLDIDPMAAFNCSPTNISFTANATDATGGAVMDCETFTYLWDGPNGFSSTEQNPVLAIINPTAQSGTYVVTVSGSNGCLGSASLELNGTTCSALLPVELVKFDVEKNGTSSLITWETASEIDNDYFEVQHSTDGINFIALDQIQGHGTSFSQHEYRYIHTTPTKGINYYRLKQVDYDDTQAYSDIKSVRFESNEIEINIYPNPTAEYVQITGLNKDLNNRLLVYNKTGQIVIDKLLHDNAEIDLSTLPSGVFLFKVINENQKPSFIKPVIKM